MSPLPEVAPYVDPFSARYPVTVWPHKMVSGCTNVLVNAAGKPVPVDDKGDLVPRHPVIDTPDAFAKVYTTDAHFVPYVILGPDGRPIAGPRVNKAGGAKLAEAGFRIRFTLVPLDVDSAAVHGSAVAADDEWRADQWAKLAALEAALGARALKYDTRGGLRAGFALATWLDEVAYLELLAGVHAFARDAGLLPDRLVDAQRCYRLPFVTRDGQPQQRRADLGVTPLSDKVVAELRELGRAHPLREPKAPRHDAPVIAPGPCSQKDRPGDWLTVNVAWREILEPHGWQYGGVSGEQEIWYRPGKAPSGAPSALTNYEGGGYFFVFTTNSNLEPQRAYDKLGALAALEGISISDAASLVRKRWGLETDYPDEDVSCVEYFFEGKSAERPELAAVRVARAERRQITIRVGELPRMVEEAVDALHEHEQLYHRYGSLCYMARGLDKVLVAKPHTVPSLGLRLAKVAAWNVWKAPRAQSGGVQDPNPTLEPADVPDKVTKALLSAEDEWLPKARVLAGFLDTPLLRPNGEIVQVEGYDDESRYFIDFGGRKWPAIPENPTRGDAEAALARILDLFCDFPFASPADKSAAVALVLTSLVRAVLKAAPAFLADSATPGAGKGLIIHLAAIIMTGAVAPTSPEIAKPDDLQKWITSMLVSGARLILIDNLTHKFGSGAFDAVMTSEGDWSDRVLGKTEIVKAPNRALWTMTGRNIQTKGDAYRRALRIRIDTDLERPEERTGLKYPDLQEYVLEHREELVIAALTVMRAYVGAGRPAPLPMAAPSFRSWSRLVREPLVWLGQADPIETQEALRMSSNGELPQLSELLSAWHGALGDAAHTLCEAIAAARPVGGNVAMSAPNKRLAEAITEITQLDMDDRKLNRVLADKIRCNAGRSIRGLRIERGKKVEDGVKWSVVSVDGTPAPPVVSSAGTDVADWFLERLTQ